MQHRYAMIRLKRFYSFHFIIRMLYTYRQPTRR